MDLRNLRSRPREQRGRIRRHDIDSRSRLHPHSDQPDSRHRCVVASQRDGCPISPDFPHTRTLLGAAYRESGYLARFSRDVGHPSFVRQRTR